MVNQCLGSEQGRAKIKTHTFSVGFLPDCCFEKSFATPVGRFFVVAKSGFDVSVFDVWWQ